MRTYGKYELLYNESREKGSVYLRFPDDEPPAVEKARRPAGLMVTTRDLLTGGEQIAIPADLVVLVTGMVPRENEELVKTLKLPVGRRRVLQRDPPQTASGRDRGGRRVHLRSLPDPKNSAESCGIGTGGGHAERGHPQAGLRRTRPLVRMVDTDMCTGAASAWRRAPTRRLAQDEADGKTVARVIDRAACKGCGGCVPVCPEKAIDLQGYTDAQIRAMIDGFLRSVTVP